MSARKQTVVSGARLAALLAEARRDVAILQREGVAPEIAALAARDLGRQLDALSEAFELPQGVAS